MPSELLHLPPLYAIVGLYRLATDPSIRTPVLDKVRHAAVRGIVVGGVYTALSWKVMDWFIQKFLISGGWWRKGEGVLKDRVDGSVKVGLGKFSLSLNVVFCEFSESRAGVDMVLTEIPDTHLLILLPQLSSILRFFIYKNLKLARSRAYALTVSSRRKPAEFWSQVSVLHPPDGLSPTSNPHRDILKNGLNHLEFRPESSTKMVEGCERI